MVARVFPHRTKATPTDDMAFCRFPNLLDHTLGITEVRVSVTFSWDKPRAERMAEAWGAIAPTSIGGPATGARGEEFTPGLYLKQGYVITSRGCPNRCWFCNAWKREGELRELPITEGWNVLDDNLLACPEEHIRGVFDMLRTQRHEVQFTGGLEAARLKPWHVDLLASFTRKPVVFFAYDEPADFEPLVTASSLLWSAGFRQGSHRVGCYVLAGWPDDTPADAEARCQQVLDLGITPRLMLYQDGKPREVSRDWQTLRRTYFRPAIIHGRTQ